MTTECEHFVGYAHYVVSPRNAERLLVVYCMSSQVSGLTEEWQWNVRRGRIM